MKNTRKEVHLLLFSIELVLWLSSYFITEVLFHLRHLLRYDIIYVKY